MKLLFKVGTHPLHAVNVIPPPPKVGEKLTITNQGEVNVLVDEIRETGAGTVFFVQRW